MTNRNVVQEAWVDLCRRSAEIMTIEELSELDYEDATPEVFDRVLNTALTALIFLNTRSKLGG